MSWARWQARSVLWGKNAWRNDVVREEGKVRVLTAFGRHVPEATNVDEMPISSREYIRLQFHPEGEMGHIWSSRYGYMITI